MMSVDKFGRIAGKRKSIRGRDGIGFALTSKGHYDLKYKRLTNVLGPEGLDDVATKRFVESSSKTAELLAIKTSATAIRDYVVGNSRELTAHVEKFGSYIAMIMKDIKTVKDKYTDEYLKEQIRAVLRQYIKECDQTTDGSPNISALAALVQKPE